VEVEEEVAKETSNPNTNQRIEVVKIKKVHKHLFLF
jgi:hypothetical protein